MQSKPNFRSKVLKGGIYMTLRQIITACLSLVSILVIARILGPTNYGIITITLGLFYFLAFTGRLGLNTYLIRQPDLPEDACSQILGFYNTVGITLCVLIWLAAPLAGWWTQTSEVTIALRWVIPGIWLHSVSRAIVGMLERDVRFVEVGFIEFASQIGNYLFAVPFVLFLHSQNNPNAYLGPIIGTVIQFGLQTLISQYVYKAKWSLRWQWLFLKPALQYGLTFSLSDAILNLRNLRVSVLVSRFVGIEAAGIISIAIRLVDQLSLLRLVIRRMSISVIAKFLDDTQATCRAVSKGMAYQTLLIGPLCAGFACVAAWLLPFLFGEEWSLSAEIFPLIALGALVSAIFDLHASTLYAAGHNRDVAISNLSYVMILWLSCLFLLPIIGLWGYGISELVALPCFFLIHRYFVRFCGRPNYRPAYLLILAAAPPLLLGPYLSLNFHPIAGLIVFMLSYGLFFTLNPTLREIALELWQSFLRKKQTN